MMSQFVLKLRYLMLSYSSFFDKNVKINCIKFLKHYNKKTSLIITFK